MTTPHFSRGPPPPFNLTYTPILEPYHKSARQWLTDNDKHYDGLATSALVFDAEGRILLIQRAAHDSMPNRWEPPGGAVDASDATLLDGAARELWEETGLLAEGCVRLVTEGAGRGPGAVFTNRTGAKILYRFTFEVVVAGWEGVSVDPNEHQDFVWASEEEVRAGKVGEREIPLTNRQIRTLLLEGFRLKKGGAAAGEGQNGTTPTEG